MKQKHHGTAVPSRPGKKFHAYHPVPFHPENYKFHFVTVRLFQSSTFSPSNVSGQSRRVPRRKLPAMKSLDFFYWFVVVTFDAFEVSPIPRRELGGKTRSKSYILEYRYHIGYFLHQTLRFLRSVRHSSISAHVRPVRPPARSTTSLHSIWSIPFILSVRSQ